MTSDKQHQAQNSEQPQEKGVEPSSDSPKPKKDFGFSNGFVLFVIACIVICAGLIEVWYYIPDLRHVIVISGVIAGLVGVYPVTYIAYLSSGSKAQFQRLKVEFGLLGLIGEDEKDDDLERLFQTAYNPIQFAAYIILIIIISVAILLGYGFRHNIPIIEEQTITLMFWGYLGAYIFSIQELIRRYNTFDLQPQIYSSIVVRMLVAAAITFVGSLAIIASGSQVTTSATGSQPTITSWGPGILAFIIGVFPNRGIRWFIRIANQILKSPDSHEQELSIRRLLGVSSWHEARLNELGIDDAQNLATVDIRKLLLTTQFDPQEIIHWIDQAILYVKVGDKIDRFREANITTFHEFRTVLNSLSDEAKNRLATLAGMVDKDDLKRFSDASNFPNYKYVAAYYSRIGTIIRKRADVGMEKVIGAMKVSDYTSAIEEGTNALKNNPDNPDPVLLNIMGEAYYKLGRKEEALAAYTEALKINDQLVSAYYNRSLIYTDTKEYARAIQDCTKAIKINRAHAEAFNNRALAHMNLGALEYALNDLNEALRLDDRLARAYFNRGNTYNSIGKYDEAIKDFEKAYLLRYDPEADIWIGRGVAFLGLEDYDKAIEEFSQTILYEPEAGLAYARRGYAYFQAGKIAYSEDERKEFYSKAQADLATAIEKDPELLDAYVNLGLLKVEQMKLDEAIGYYNRALEKAPMYIPARYNLGIAYEKSGRVPEARREFEHLVHNDPDQKTIETKHAQDWLAQYASFEEDSSNRQQQ